jgi:hypothetical protein
LRIRSADTSGMALVGLRDVADDLLRVLDVEGGVASGDAGLGGWVRIWDTERYCPDRLVSFSGTGRQ